MLSGEQGRGTIRSSCYCQRVGIWSSEASVIFFWLTWFPVTTGWLAACKKYGRSHAFGWVLPSVVKCIFSPLSWCSDILNPSWLRVPWKCKHSGSQPQGECRFITLTTINICSCWIGVEKKASRCHSKSWIFIWHTKPFLPGQQWPHSLNNSNVWFNFFPRFCGGGFSSVQHREPRALAFASLHQIDLASSPRRSTRLINT